MELTGSSFNPYQPPAAMSDSAALAPDTEFLFNDKVVAGVGRIVLPRICVLTGETESLVARESRLWWCDRWLTNVRFILVLAAVFGGIPMLTHLPAQILAFPPKPGIEESLQLMIGAALVVLAVGSVAMVFMLRKSIVVRWFISESCQRRSTNRQWVMALLAVAATSLNWFYFGVRDWGVMLIPMIWMFGSVVQLVRGKRVLFVAGTIDGLFLIGGLSDAFLAETQRLVTAYAAKDK